MRISSDLLFSQDSVTAALKTQEWKTRHEVAGAENAGVENTGVKNVARRKTGPACQRLGESIGVGRTVCSVICRGGFPRSVCVRFPSRFSRRRRRRLLVSLRAGSDEKMQQDRSERIVWT